MTRRSLLSAAAVAAMFTAVLWTETGCGLDRLTSPDPDPRPFASLRGIVRDVTSGAPIANARVVLRHENAALEVQTDAEGRYSIGTFAAIQQLTVEATGYLAFRETLNLQPGENVRDVNLTRG